MWQDFSDGPLFVYAFSDDRRFLCDYDYDTARVVFVVDLDAEKVNLPMPTFWNGELRSYTARSATNVVYDTKGTARLPTEAELREVSDYLTRASQSEINRASFPYCDFGIFRSYEPKEALLLDLSTNRSSYWPLQARNN